MANTVITAGAISVDTVTEATSAAGVTLDGVLLKDTTIKAWQPVTAAAGDGAITISAGAVAITKSSLASLTLAAPSSQNGLIIHIVSTTAFAHVITATDLLEDGVTGGAKDTATFAAFAGASITLMAYGTTWIVVSSNNVTVAAA